MILNFLQQETAQNVVRLCLKAQRSSGGLGIEVGLSTGVSAVVLICAQLASGFKTQLYVKLFALLIQTITFQNIAGTEALMAAVRVPKICEFLIGFQKLEKDYSLRLWNTEKLLIRVSNVN